MMLSMGAMLAWRLRYGLANTSAKPEEGTRYPLRISVGSGQARTIASGLRGYFFEGIRLEWKFTGATQ